MTNDSALPRATVRSRNIDTGMIGCGWRRQRRRNAANATTATAAVPTTGGEVQPNVEPPQAATSATAVVHTASSAAPATSRRSPVRSGTARGTATTASSRATPPIGALIQKIQRQPTVSVRPPPSSGETTLAIANTDAIG